MKRDSIGNKAAEYGLLVAVGFACAYGFLAPFVPSQMMKDNVLPIFFGCAAAVFLDLLFKKTTWFLVLLATADVVMLSLYRMFSDAAGSPPAASGLSAAGEAQIRSSGFVSACLCVFAAFVSLLAAHCGRRRLTVAIFWAGTTALSGYLSYTGHGENLPALLVVTGGCAVLFYRAGVKAGLKRTAGGGKLLLRTTAAAMGVLAAVLAVTQIGFTGLETIFRSYPRIDVSDFTTRLQGSLFSTSGFEDYDPNRLIGLRTRVNETPVLEVRADGPFYLRGRIYDTYTGKSWRAAPSSEGDDVYHQSLSPLTSGSSIGQFRQRNFLYNPFSGSILFLSYHQISVTTKTEGQKYLFLPAVIAGGIGSRGDETALKHTYPDLETARPLPLGTEYSLTYWQPDLSSRVFLNGAGNQGNRSDGFAAERQIDGEIQTAFGSTAGLTARTVALAKSITKNCSDEFQKAEAVKRWLADNCTYTLSPPQPWGGQDFVDYFLFNSKKGYCEHFATAMTMLMRASGVPARYIEGYASPTVSGSGLYEVTNAQAHSWVEFYSPLCGFLPSDPTPASALPRPLTQAEAQRTPSQGSSSAPSSEAPPPSSEPASSAASSFAPSSLSPRSPAASSGVLPGNRAGADFSAGFLVAALIVLLVLFPYAGKAAYRALWFAVIRRRDDRTLVLSLYGYFAAVLAKLGFRVPSAGTPQELADKVRGQLRFGSVSFDRVTRLYLEVRFGERGLTAVERKEWISFYHALPAACRIKLGNLRYLLMYPFLH